MFDALTDKLQGVFSGLKGRGKLTDADIDKAMRAIRLSLLEADVSLPVVKQLTTAITVLALHASHHHNFRPNAAALRRHEDTATYAEG